MTRLLALLLITANVLAQTPEQMDQVVKKSLLVAEAARSASKQFTTTDLRHGTVVTPLTSNNKRTGTIDSERGVMTIYSRKDINAAMDTLTIYYDIGRMAGTHMCRAFEKDCSYYTEKIINGEKAAIGLRKRDDKTELIVTIGSVENRSEFANFWMTVKKHAEVANFLEVVFSYKKK